MVKLFFLKVLDGSFLLLVLDGQLVVQPQLPLYPILGDDGQPGHATGTAVASDGLAKEKMKKPPTSLQRENC